MDVLSKLASLLPGRAKTLKELENSKTSIVNSIDFFHSDVDNLNGRYIRKEELNKILDDHLGFYNYIYSKKIPIDHELYSSVTWFVNTYRNLPEAIEIINSQYMREEKQKTDLLLSDIDGKSLDEQQREAVLSQDKNNLVIAGAGSGKTLTIAGKVKYLCEVKGLKPEEILLISFTRKSAEEMTDRIANKLGYNVQATTFHGLGLGILKQAKRKMYDVVDDLPQFISSYFSSEINNDENIIRSLIHFFAYYLQIPPDRSKFNTIGEMYEYEKSMDLETIKSKYTAASFARKQAKDGIYKSSTIKGETVKSLEEIEIANFLFLHGINYEYEKLYPVQDEESARRAYHPDFYLSDYGIYLEHFGIDSNGRCPWLSDVEEQKYIEDMEWKRSWHKKNNTKLIETYSYYQNKGILLSKLEELLIKNGVHFKPINLTDVFNEVYVKQEKKYFSEFISLCSSFITLFKSNGYEEKDLGDLIYKNVSFDNSFFTERRSIFLQIISKLYNGYQNHLKEHNAFDFADMINLATKTVQEGFEVPKYKYVIIDEFQDISVARYKLIKTILDQTGADLMCVGDDWQSIYRFAGSDISLFTKFESYFGPTKIMRIEKTYRNSQELIDIAGNFVMENPLQFKKGLRSDKHINDPLIIKEHDNDPSSVLISTVNEIIKKEGKNKSILLLGRTNNDFNIIKKTKKFGGTSSRLIYVDSPDTPISFMTVHRSKGLEADNVVLLNFENSTLGFPNKIADDPLLELVLSNSDEYRYAEERRLFYVAITRTKNRTYILMNSKKPSEFYKSIENNVHSEESETTDDTSIFCPRCVTGKLVKRIGMNRKIFYGCTNYPKCDYVANDVKSVESRRVCPSCGGFLTLKKGRFGGFYGCTNYPTCQYTERVDEIPMCPECGADMKLRKGKNGLFWGCENYPECKGVKAI